MWLGKERLELPPLQGWKRLFDAPHYNRTFPLTSILGCIPFNCPLSSPLKESWELAALSLYAVFLSVKRNFSLENSQTWNFSRLAFVSLLAISDTLALWFLLFYNVQVSFASAYFTVVPKVRRSPRILSRGALEPWIPAACPKSSYCSHLSQFGTFISIFSWDYWTPELS